MPHCPTCQSSRIIIVISSAPRASCLACGTRWIQEGSYQRGVRVSGAGRILPGGARWADFAADSDDALLGAGRK